ncbi:MAG: ATP-binding protein [Bacteroidota bacterium]
MILKSVLFDIINSQQNNFFKRELKTRRELINDLKDNISRLVIINGIKRTGKSTFLFQLYKENFQDVFYINFEHPGLYDFEQNDFFKLDEIITASGNEVLFFDEITELKGWQNYVRQKFEEGFTVVLTASNSEILNNEEGLNLTGRYVIKDLLPFSFTEFCSYHEYKKDEKAVVNYMKQGGFPGNLENDNDDYLSQLFDDIVVRETGLRFGVRDIKSFKRLAMHLLLNVGELITGNQLKSLLGIKTTSTVMDYLSFLESGFLFHYVPKFSYSVRKQMINPRKVYVVDTGFVGTNTFSAENKTEQLLENLVYLRLRQQYSELNYYSEMYTCDFVAFGKNRAVKAVQVCGSLQQDNLEKELNGLYEAMEFFEFAEGTLVTMNQSDRFERNGKVINVVPFYEF